MGKRAKRKRVVIERKREFRYMGKTFEELRELSLTELLPLLPARARRSLKRGFSEDVKKFLDRAKTRDYVETHRRDVIILPMLVGKKVGIHNGREFKVVEVKPEMIGHRLGEFALTRKPVKHAGPGVGATRSSKHLPLK